MTEARSAPTVIDSSGWIEYLTGGPKSKSFEKYLSEKDLVVASITLAEIAAKFHAAGRGGEVKGVLGSIREKARVWEISEAVADEAGKLRLRHKLGMADAIILATARVNNALLVTGDNDFRGLENTAVL